MKLYVTRHGETEFNAKDLISGTTDIPLTERGKAQAQEMAEKVAACGDITRIIASPMLRARMTAQYAADALGLPVQIDERLREWDYGEYEGKTRYTPGFAEAKTAFGCKMPGGGESVFQLVQRTYNVLDDIRRRYPEDTVLVVCHGGVCRIIDSYFEDMSVERFSQFFMGSCELRVYTL